MSIGMLTSGNSWSSVKYTGSPIATRLLTTIENQELVQFLDNGGKPISCNSVTVEAGAVDLYFSVWVFNNKNKDNVDNVDFTNEAVFYCKAGTTINISGLSIGAIKFANNLGAEYFIQALSY